METGVVADACQVKYYQYDLDVEYKFSLWTYCRNCLTSLSLLYGQCCVIDYWTCQFRKLQLSYFVQHCDPHHCPEVFPNWACPMLWWIAKNLMTNSAYDAWAAGLLKSAVHIDTPQWHMSILITSNWMLRAHIHRSAPSMKYDLWSKVAQITNKGKLILEAITTSTNGVFVQY